MTRARGPRALTLFAMFASFGAGVLVDGWLRAYGPPKPVQAHALADVQLPKATAPAPVDAVIAAAPPPSANQPASIANRSTIAADPVVTAGTRSAPPLRVPIDGVNVESFKGGFAERRGSTRPHEAVDILVPRGTPVHAVTDGTIAKLFFSKAGGTTIYEFDAEARLCYYYAHLDRYADSLHEGQHIAQGEIIGYVGTSGNAPANTPHLHFAVFELNADKHWWQGRVLDPYEVFKSRG